MKLHLAFLVAALSIVATACDHPPTVETDDPRLRVPDAGVQPEGGAEVIIRDDDPDGGPCEPATCGELGLDCGKVADGCGGLRDCGECAEGSLCGIVAHNLCTRLEDLCKPLSLAEACDDRECGAAGDGCGGVVECGECESGEACGLFEPYQCGQIPVNEDERCVAGVSSCEEAGVECGLVGNGCGGVLDCDAETGGCDDGEYCGLGGAGRCGAPEPCMPRSMDEACDGKCGMVSNGCGEEVSGGLIDCSEDSAYACDADEACGAGGVVNECGNAVGACLPMAVSVACSAVECGMVSDGCDGSYSCGGCDLDELCRDGMCEAFCLPLTDAEACQGVECGVVSDGCGGSVACGSCPDGAACGQYEPFVCAPLPGSACVPQAIEEACGDKECGLVLDGCGSAAENTYDCADLNGGCPDGELCGARDTFECDAPSASDCVPASSCAELGWECGMAVDECGTIFDCADEGIACNSETETCIGGVSGPAQCLTGFEVLNQGDCEVCDAIPNCFGQEQPTRITGRVITPGRNNADQYNQVGVPNAFVYILQTTNVEDLPAIPAGIPEDGSGYLSACDRCEDQDLGPVLISTTTNSAGGFVLEGSIPVDQDFLLVVKTGKWRRAQVMHLAPDAACQTTSIDELSTRLPRSSSDGEGAHLPRIAVSTGRVDAIECVLYKMGVDATEFNQPGADGNAPNRVHMYRADQFGGASPASGSTSHSELHGDLDRVFSYDMLVFDCQGTDVEHDADDPTIREFVNRGGRMFASHWSYTWLHDNGDLSYAQAVTAGNPYDTGLSASAVWVPSPGSESVDTGLVSVGRPGASPTKVQAFADWLVFEGSATAQTDGTYTLNLVDPRDLATSVGTATEEYVYRYADDPALGAGDFCRPCSQITEETCITNTSCTWNANNGTCTVANDCNTKTQAACNADPDCEFVSGACSFAKDCNEDNVDNDEEECIERPLCGWNQITVQQLSFNTPYGAPTDDICGRVAYSGFHVVAEPGFDYSNSVFPEHCLGALSSQEKVLLYALFDLGACVSDADPEPPDCTPLGVDACEGRCGNIGDGCGGILDCDGCPEGEVCQPSGVCGPPGCLRTSCAAQGATCGAMADGCGGVLDCGTCDEGQECGLVVANQCAMTCTPFAEAEVCNASSCGFISNGCDAVYDCGNCPDGLTCVDQTCTTSECEPLTACPEPANCGVISDGCAGTLDCGECELPEICAGGGEANVCDVRDCDAITCDDLDATCGWIGDGCGGSVFCGDCPTGAVCGGAEPNQCVGCVPLTCDDVGAECGAIGDGCGKVVHCGDCPDGESCGGRAANQCSPDNTCPPQSCEDLGAECGLVGDGCGETIDCGECDKGQVCGVDRPFQCGDPPECDPLSCKDVGAECGAIGDGCGGLVECGTCPPGRECGRDHPNRCPRNVDDPH